MKHLAVLLIGVIVLIGCFLFDEAAPHAVGATGLFFLGFCSGIAAALHFRKA